MNIRRITSLTALLSFVLVFITSIILYVVPQGRIAYWAEWRLLGLGKEEWGYIHINIGFLFIVSIFLHIYYNWKPILSYLKNKARELKVFTKDFNAALIITLAFLLGTLFQVPPFMWIIDINTYLKDSAAVKYGEPPYGHAELSSLKTFVSKMGWNSAESMERLKASGVKVDHTDQTLADIAQKNHITPQQVYRAMKPEKESGSRKTLPQNPPPGTGNQTLADICQTYSLKIPFVIRALSENGIKGAAAEKNLKNIASENGRSPVDIYEIIRKTAEE